jgi:hypothetical protein
MKKQAILFSVFLFQVGFIFSQNQMQTYDNFEGKKVLHYVSKSGMLDTAAQNPKSNEMYKKDKCAKYVRNGKMKFDNIKMNLTGKLSDVSSYATHAGMPPKIKMKVYTTAPVGTLVEIQLGKKDKGVSYPVGINSQFQAHTTVSNAWEELEFKFSQMPQGSETSATEIDQITLMFNPNSLTSDTYYFSDITGPSLVSEKSVSDN